MKDSDTIPEPREVFRQFYALAAIPRRSGNEGPVSDWLLGFARERGLRAVRDGAMNVVIYKPGSAGCAGSPPVILQAHMDMVCAAEDGLRHDFAVQGITPVVRDGWLRAAGTSLGADNGLGIAYILALLDAGDIPHPPLEAVFTAAEETGLHGALAFDASALEGRNFINLDYDREGLFCVSCAGGMTVRLSLPITAVPAAACPEAGAGRFFTLRLGGLRGGHSGVEIDKQRGNACRLLGRVLRDLQTHFCFDLAGLRGGFADNAIPRSAEAVLRLPERDVPAVTERLRGLQQTLARELAASEEAGAPEITLTAAEALPEVWDADTAARAVRAAGLLPDGPEAFDLSIPGQRLVETSANFAMITEEPGRLVFTVSIRSSRESKKAAAAERIVLLAEALGGTAETGSAYPGWEYRPESPLRRIFNQAYARVYDGADAREEGVHAGLECGVFAEHFRRLGREADMISLGPVITGGHTPEEAAGLASAARTWRLIREALALLCAEPGQ